MSKTTTTQSAYYRVLYVYYVGGDNIPRIAIVAINKSHDKKQYDELLAKDSFFNDKKIEGYTIEHIVDYTELDSLENCNTII